MDYHNHFYITVFSKASPKTYPGNTLAEVTVQLAKRIDLGSIGSWEVGLCESNCPPSDVATALIYCDLMIPQFFWKSVHQMFADVDKILRSYF
jgi:hypothetical protein